MHPRNPMLKRIHRVAAAVSMTALLSVAATNMAAVKQEMRDMKNLECKDVMIQSVEDRDISNAFVHC